MDTMLVNQRLRNGGTVLMEASLRGLKKVVDVLLQKVSDENV